MAKKYRSSVAGGKPRKCQEGELPISQALMHEIYDLGTEAKAHPHYYMRTLEQVTTLHSTIVLGQFSQCNTKACLNDKRLRFVK